MIASAHYLYKLFSVCQGGSGHRTVSKIAYKGKAAIT